MRTVIREGWRSRRRTPESFAAPCADEDLIKAGIIDPTKVVRTAFQVAASVAGLLLTIEAMVGEKPKNEPTAAPPPSLPHGAEDF